MGAKKILMLVGDFGEKIWGQACNIVILSLSFAYSLQNFISRQYPADGSLH
jgi:hypothetical protein